MNQFDFMCQEYIPPLPHHLPDTPSGKAYALTLAKDRRKTYFNKPPNMRQNLIKLKVQFPFHQPWDKLIRSVQELPSMRNIKTDEIGSGLAAEVMSKLGIDHESDDITPHVMRDQDILRVLKYIFSRSGSKRRVFRGLAGESTLCTIKPKDALPFDRISLCEVKNTLNTAIQTSCNVLVRCTLTLIGRGTIDECAMICLPSDQDMMALDNRLKDDAEKIINLQDTIVEVAGDDCNDVTRKELRADHKRNLVCSFPFVFIEICRH